MFERHIIGGHLLELPFLDRAAEIAKIRKLLGIRNGTFAAIYGRRRCGKSRLLRETLPEKRTLYFVGDDREAALQRSSLAAEMARFIPGFDQVTYPDWDALLGRWWTEARAGTILVLDEFPALVAQAPELPSLLQKRIDRQAKRQLHVVVSGSSQSMMQGLVLDRASPLFGRAQAILKIGPLSPGWISDALGLADAIEAIESYAVWGGVPRYWELAAGYPNLETAVRELVLSPLGVLHEEPAGLLLDDLRDTTQAASILSLIGKGCHRASEIAGRLGKPATSLSRPLQRLMELEFVRRDLPFGTTTRDTKRTAYHVADPLLRFWFRFVEPNHSRLEARQILPVMRDVKKDFPHHVGSVWEDLARASVVGLRYGRAWRPASRWWGPGLDRHPVEIDIVAESEQGDALLLGEVAWSRSSPERLIEELRRKAGNLPITKDRRIFLAAWTRSGAGHVRGTRIFGPEDVLRALR